MADLKGVHDGINYSLKANNLPELTEDELLVKLFDEVAYVWPKLCYPPLVTPFSQYVKNVALLNIVQLAKGEERYSMMDDNTWNMILGKAGQLPGKLAPEIIELAKNKGKKFYTGVPQNAYPDQLDKYRKEMKEKNWELGENEEELFEFAMHETQYRDYKSGLAKTRFEEELEKVESQNNIVSKTSVAVKDKQTPNRNSYSKNKVEYPIAMIAFVLYSLNSGKLNFEENCKKTNRIWDSIGYWRNRMSIEVYYNEENYSVNINKINDDNYEFELQDNVYSAEMEYIDKGEIDFKLNKQKYFASFSMAKEAMTKVSIKGEDFLLKRNDLLDGEIAIKEDDSILTDEEINIVSPIPGRIFKINVKEGDKINKGDIVMVIDAMKMENNIVSKKDAVVNKILVALDQMVDAGAHLIEIE